MKLPAALGLLLAAATMFAVAACDEWEPALGVGLTSRGAPAVYPVLCDGESAVSVELLDSGVSDHDDISEDEASPIWRSESRPPGTTDDALIAGEPAVGFVETIPVQRNIKELSPDRWLVVRVTVQRGDREIRYEENYEVADFEAGTVYAYFYGLLSEDEWEQAKQNEICDAPYPGLVTQLADATGTPRALWVVASLACALGALFGIAWLGKRLGKPKAPPTPPGPD